MTLSPNRRMFFRLWLRSLVVKRPQALLALASLAVGAAVASLLLNLYGGARRKMTEEFRAYGANVIVTPRESASTAASNVTGQPGASGVDSALLDESVMTRVESLAPHAPGLGAAPVLYVVARATPGASKPIGALGEGANLVVVGTDFAALRQMNPGWHVEGGESVPESGTCVLGAHAAARLGVGAGGTIELQPLGAENRNSKNKLRSSKLEIRNSKMETRNSKFQNRTPVESAISDFQFPISNFQFRVSAVLATGAAEDDQIFVPLHSLQALSNLPGKLSLVELSVPGETAGVERAVRDLRAALAAGVPGESGGPGEWPVEVRAVPQILASEGKVLDTLRGLLVSLTGLILGIVALCVMATVTVIVLERRKDVAVMKALGASDRLVMRLFLSEISALGLAGGLLGFAAGALLARDLGRRLFGVTLNPAWWSLPAICAASLLVAVLSTLLPVRNVRSVQPALVLKGE
ncbi:MAG TPA: ABC transporter permease [Terriglobia bacterium]|nr:ABC transporter permease [Terriglobia bacterium]